MRYHLMLFPIWTHLLHSNLRIEVSKNRCFRNSCGKCFLHFLFLLRCIRPVQHSICDGILPFRLFPLRIPYRLSTSTSTRSIGTFCCFRLLRFIDILKLICLFPVNLCFLLCFILHFFAGDRHWMPLSCYGRFTSLTNSPRCFNALMGLSYYDTRIARATGTWRFNALMGLSCYYHQTQKPVKLIVSMPSWAWVVTILFASILTPFLFQCPHGLELLPCTTSMSGSNTLFQCPHGLELLHQLDNCIDWCFCVSMPSWAWVVTQ